MRSIRSRSDSKIGRSKPELKDSNEPKHEHWRPDRPDGNSHGDSDSLKIIIISTYKRKKKKEKEEERDGPLTNRISFYLSA